MKVITTVLELKKELRSQSGSIGFVPTMGSLHDGHTSLMSEAKLKDDILVVSIFVNPTQFLEGEDLENYPRDNKADKLICEKNGVDFLFLPQVDEIYRVDEVSLNAPNVKGYILEGSERPGHFSGVLTVVNKLFNIVKPTHAYFGRKDAQQLFLIKQMVQNLYMDVIVIEVDTLREEGGLAQSSRNIYLSSREREDALRIYESLIFAKGVVSSGELSSDIIEFEMREILSALDVEHIAIVSREFDAIKSVKIGETIIVVEVVVGITRLLDNIYI
ncbi:MAG: pantoate--beta-alanine ligase [Helicobacteraceae bacterium]|nr:pantoate--beta-alanine ligase [Helicobacteraceae bacterium]